MSQPQYGRATNTMDRQQQSATPGFVRSARERIMGQSSPEPFGQQVSVSQYTEATARRPLARPTPTASPLPIPSPSPSSAAAGTPGDAGMSRIPRLAGNTMQPRNQSQTPLSMRVDPAEAIGVAISQPIPIQQPIQQQQWPFPQAAPDAPSYQPPPGRSQPPPRPPRPSKVISMVENNQPQLQLQVPNQRQIAEYSPDFSPEDSDDVNTAYTPSSRPSVSSVGSIPDFPVPMPPPPPEPQQPQPTLQRRTTLGPPPSSRRGASSFYSTQSYVDPIPEESSQISRSHSSFASSMAIPDDFDSSELASRSGLDSDEEELTPYAQNGFLARAPSLVVTRPDTDSSSNNSDASEVTARGNPFLSTEEFQDPSRSPNLPPGRSPFGSPGLAGSLVVNNVPQRSPQPITPDHIRQSLLAAAETAPAMLSQSPNSDNGMYSRMSAIRRPPKLDINAANAGRNSTTSLPDMIRRATRLAYMIDKGKRPASNASPEFEFVDNLQVRGSEFYSVNGRQSGLSDMLAAFPPPANPQLTPPAEPNRTSRIRSFIKSPSSWPFPPNRSPAMQQIRSPKSPLATDSTGMTPATVEKMAAVQRQQQQQQPPPQKKKGRRCCGLPMWGFVLLMIILLALAAAAIVIPLEFFVFRKNNGSTSASSQSDTDQCVTTLPCLNGGTSVVLNGECSCICVNGFTGDNCGVAGATGCTTTTLVTTSNTTDSISNVTLGLAIPRLIAEAESAFSVPLSGTQILAHFNSGNLSCVAQNSLVTFDGSATRLSSSSTDDDTETSVVSSKAKEKAKQAVIEVPTITVPAVLTTNAVVADKLQNKAEVTTDVVVTVSTASVRTTTVVTVITTTVMTKMPDATASTAITTTFTSNVASTTTITLTTTTTAVATATASFAASQDAIDFARVAVLFVLQQTDIQQASTAQAALEDFFTNTDNITAADARNITLGNNNFVNLINFRVQVGTTVAGSGNSTADDDTSNGSVAARMAISNGGHDDDDDDDDNDKYHERAELAAKSRRRAASYMQRRRRAVSRTRSHDQLRHTLW